MNDIYIYIYIYIHIYIYIYIYTHTTIVIAIPIGAFEMCFHLLHNSNDDIKQQLTHIRRTPTHNR